MLKQIFAAMFAVLCLGCSSSTPDVLVIGVDASAGQADNGQISIDIRVEADVQVGSNSSSKDAAVEDTAAQDVAQLPKCNTAADCDDGEPCTIDTCDPVTGCKYKIDIACVKATCASNSECEDGNVCTEDICVSGKCQHTGFDNNIYKKPCEGDLDSCTEERCVGSTCQFFDLKIGKGCVACNVDQDCVNSTSTISSCSEDDVFMISEKSSKCDHKFKDGYCKYEQVEVVECELGCSSPYGVCKECDDEHLCGVGGGAQCTFDGWGLSQGQSGKCLETGMCEQIKKEFNCDDNNPCTADLCDLSVEGNCSHIPQYDYLAILEGAEVLGMEVMQGATEVTVLKFSMFPQKNTKVFNVKVERSGLGLNSDIENVSLWKDGMKYGQAAGDQQVYNFGAFTVQAQSQFDFEVRVSFAQNAVVGNSHKFSLMGVDAMSDCGDVQVMNLPIAGNSFMILDDCGVGGASVCVGNTLISSWGTGVSLPDGTCEVKKDVTVCDDGDPLTTDTCTDWGCKYVKYWGVRATVPVSPEVGVTTNVAISYPYLEDNKIVSAAIAMDNSVPWYKGPLGFVEVEAATKPMVKDDEFCGTYKAGLLPTFRATYKNGSKVSEVSELILAEVVYHVNGKEVKEPLQLEPIPTEYIPKYPWWMSATDRWAPTLEALCIKNKVP